MIQPFDIFSIMASKRYAQYFITLESFFDVTFQLIGIADLTIVYDLLKSRLRKIVSCRSTHTERDWQHWVSVLNELTCELIF